MDFRVFHTICFLLGETLWHIHSTLHSSTIKQWELTAHQLWWVNPLHLLMMNSSWPCVHLHCRTKPMAINWPHISHHAGCSFINSTSTCVLTHRQTFVCSSQHHAGLGSLLWHCEGTHSYILCSLVAQNILFPMKFMQIKLCQKICHWKGLCTANSTFITQRAKHKLLQL